MKNSQILALKELVHQSPDYLEQNMNIELPKILPPAPYIGDSGGELETAKDLLRGQRSIIH